MSKRFAVWALTCALSGALLAGECERAEVLLPVVVGGDGYQHVRVRAAYIQRKDCSSTITTLHSFDPDSLALNRAFKLVCWAYSSAGEMASRKQSVILRDLAPGEPVTIQLDLQPIMRARRVECDYWYGHPGKYWARDLSPNWRPAAPAYPERDHSASRS